MTDNVMFSVQRRGDKKGTHLAHADTISEEEDNGSGTEGEDSEVDLLTDNTCQTHDVTPTVASPLASISSGEASVLSSVGGASSLIVKSSPSDNVLMEDPDGMQFFCKSLNS